MAAGKNLSGRKQRAPFWERTGWEQKNLGNSPTFSFSDICFSMEMVSKEEKDSKRKVNLDYIKIMEPHWKWGTHYESLQ